MAAAISLAKTWNGKLGNGILLQESRTACNCPYLLLTLGSSVVNRRYQCFLAQSFPLPTAHDSPVKPELFSPGSSSRPPRLGARMLPGLGGPCEVTLPVNGRPLEPNIKSD